MTKTKRVPLATYPPSSEVCAPHVPDVTLSGGIRKDIRAEERFEGLVAIFKALADPLRIRILFAIRQGEVCVCDLAEAVESEVSAVSHHLRHLRNMRLVQARREGKRVYYTLTDEHVRTLLDQGLEHVNS